MISHLTLADISEAERNRLIIWLVVLMALVLIGFTVILLLRRYLRDPSGDSAQDAGFSLSELRAMRDRGEITSEEYEQTRARVISKVKDAANKPRPIPPSSQDGE